VAGRDAKWPHTLSPYGAVVHRTPLLFTKYGCAPVRRPPQEGGSQHRSSEVARSVNAGAIFARLLGMLDLWLAVMPNGRVATP
jgi:hypothetical protein